MANKPPVPLFVRAANVLMASLLRAGFNMMGPGKTPLYLFTVRGRRSGQPRTTPIAVLEQGGQRYLVAPYGVVDWVRNLRAAGEATFTRGRRAEQLRATELPAGEAGLVLKTFIATGNPIGRFFGISAEASREEYERLASTHPVFMLQNVAAALERS